MKRSIVYLGLCVALGLGISISIKASGNKFIKVCCDQHLGACQKIGNTIVRYGPSVYPGELCP